MNEKLTGCFWGLALGDALGVPVEFHSIEKLNNKAIPSSEKFNNNSTCYVRAGEEITGLRFWFNYSIKDYTK